MSAGWPLLDKGAGARSAHDLVAQGLGRGIVQGHFAPGTILPGDGELTERFGVSRTALREALKTLAAKGLIEPKTRVGTRVLGDRNWNMFDADILAWRLEQGVSRPFLESLFQIRQALEPLGAASAALSRSADDIRIMTAAWEAMCRPDHSRDSFTRADLAFHRAILVASGNPFLQSMGAVIEAALAASFTISSPVDDPDRFELSERQHRAVLDAIVNRNAQEASCRMSEVIVQGAKVAALDRPDTCEVDVTIRLFGHHSG